MTRFQIPDVFLPGFTKISELAAEKAEEIGDLLREVPVGINRQEFHTIFKDKVSGLESPFAETIFSFGGILANKKAGEDIRELALSLTNAFKEKNEEKVSDTTAEQLNQNLLTILKNAENLEKTFKAIHLLSSNAHIYRDSVILTDIRLLFEDEVENAPKCGVVLHQLKIDYVENEKLKSLFVCLDNDDLNGLIENLQRAIKKEESIKKNQDKINFISIK